MPELWEVTGAAKIRLFGPKDALDRVTTPDGVEQGRVAPDELLWLGDPGRARSSRPRASVSSRAPASARSSSTTATAGPSSRSWATGAQTRSRAFRACDCPTGASVQGKVAEVPGKVFARPGRIDLLCTSDVRWFVHGRLLHACADLGLTEGTPPASAPVSQRGEVTS